MLYKVYFIDKRGHQGYVNVKGCSVEDAKKQAAQHIKKGELILAVEKVK